MWVPGQSDSPNRHPLYSHIHPHPLSTSFFIPLVYPSIAVSAAAMLTKAPGPLLQFLLRRSIFRCNPRFGSHSLAHNSAFLFCFVLFFGCRIVRSLQELVKFPVQPVLALPSFLRSFRSADCHCLVRPWSNVFGALGAWRSRSVTSRARDCFSYSELWHLVSCGGVWCTLIKSVLRVLWSSGVEIGYSSLGSSGIEAFWLWSSELLLHQIVAPCRLFWGVRESFWSLLFSLVMALETLRELGGLRCALLV